MNHVRDTDAIRLAAGELPANEAREIRSHLARCEACRRRAEEQATLWREIGLWSPEAPVCDVSIAAGPAASQPTTPHRPWSFAAGISRIAAAVLLGVGVGYAVGRWNVSPSGQPAPAAQADSPAPTDDELGLPFLESPSPAGLYATLLDSDTAVLAEEEPS
jgi:hypothetical protein